MNTTKMKRGDTRPALRYSLPDGVDLTGASVTFSMAARPGGTPVVADRPALIVDTAPPVVGYDWQPGDTDVAGLHLGEFKVMWADGFETFPKSDYLRIDFTQGLSGVTATPVEPLPGITGTGAAVETGADAASGTATVAAPAAPPVTATGAATETGSDTANGAGMVTAPPAQIGGMAVGTQGAAGTIYEGYRLAAGEDFATLDLLTASNPAGKYIASHRRRGRRAINAGANDYYWTPDHTGHNDANRGVAIGSGSADLLAVADSQLSLSTRLATARERSLAWTTTASTGPQRPQSASALHSAGYQAVKWPCIVEARIRVPTGAQMPAGGWPAFWTEGIQPTWANTGEWDFEWTDSGRLFTNFITGNSSNDSIASQVVDTSDGEYHVWSIVATAAQLRFYKDGVLLNTATKRNDAHVPSPMFWWLRNGVDLTPSIFGMNYSASAWTGVTSKMDVDYVRLWSAPDATNLGYRGIVGQQSVAFDESISIRVPSKTELWGREDVTEILVWQPIENAEPGMTQLPVTAGGNTWYGSPTAQNGQWGPSFMSWNPEYRQISGQGYDQAGRMIGHVVAWDDAKGGTAGFARVVVNIGPRITLGNQSLQSGAITPIDIYAACDCGMLTTNAQGQRAKTITVTGLAGSGLTYDDATGMLSGNAVAGAYNISISCTNSIGQSATRSINLTVAAPVTPPADPQPGVNPAYASWTGPGWFDFSDDAAITMSGSGTNVDAVANKRAGQPALIREGASSVTRPAGLVQNGRRLIQFNRDTANPSRLVAAGGGTDAISAVCQGDDRPYTVICVYIPTDTNAGYVWSWSDTVATGNAQCIAFVKRATPNCSVRRESSGNTNPNDVSWGSGHAANAPRIVAVVHTGQAVSVWDTSLTKAIDAAPQDVAAMNTELAFRLGASEAGGSTDPLIAAVSSAMQMGELIVEARAVPDADVRQAITDLAARWGITLA